MVESDDPRIGYKSDALRQIIDEWEEQQTTIDQKDEQINELEDRIAEKDDKIEQLTESKDNQISVLQDRLDDLETDMVPVDDEDSGIIDRLGWLLRGK